MRILARIVAIFAHPDDAEIRAGGTLYKHSQRGDSVAVYSVTYAAHHSQNPAYGIDLMQRHNVPYGHRCQREYAEGLHPLPLAMVNNFPAHDHLP